MMAITTSSSTNVKPFLLESEIFDWDVMNFILSKRCRVANAGDNAVLCRSAPPQGLLLIA
jgi:hypothetical protein